MSAEPVPGAGAVPAASAPHGWVAFARFLARFEVPAWRRALAVLLVVATSFLFITQEDRVRVGFDNHAGILPVVRRILDPGHLPGDFGIRLREFHHRPFAHVIAGLSKWLGEKDGLWVLHMAGMTAVAAGALALWRSLGLPLALFPVLVALLIGKPLWIGKGTEVNEFIEFNLSMMPPVFAHGLILALLAALVERRWRIAALLTGIVFFFHVQIGIVVAICTAPLYVEALKTRGWKELPILATLSLVPALPSIVALVQMMAALARHGYWDFNYLAFRQNHHFALRPDSVRWVAWHAGAIFLAWGAGRRFLVDSGRGLGVLAWVTLSVCLLSVFHYLDYEVLRHGAIAKFQFIRLTPLLTVLSVFSVFVIGRGIAVTWAARAGPMPLRVAGIARALVVVGFVWVTFHRATHESKKWGVKASWEGEKPWPTMCRWISGNTPADALFLTPPAQDGFSLMARRSTIVDFKINPDGALYLREWYERLQDVTGEPLFTARGRRRLSQESMDRAESSLPDAAVLGLQRKYGIRYAVFQKPAAARFPVVHENGDFVLVRLPGP